MDREVIRLGILGCAEIAYRRFMPAAQKTGNVQVITVAEEYAPEKLDEFCNAYQLGRDESFQALLERRDLGAVYIPQPPAFHYPWAKEALLRGKHVLVEKPATTSLEDTKKLIEIASERKLALHENYMFQYHSQIAEIQKMIGQGTIGEIRLIRADFGFPMRTADDFRLSHRLGGGALLDAGGYAVRLALLFLGETARVNAASLSKIPGFDVDMYGSATISNQSGGVCQIGFGMDSAYQCSLTVWGSKGRLYTNRIFTAPEDFEPVVQIEKPSGIETRVLGRDNHFMHSIDTFAKEIRDGKERENSYAQILKQAELVESIRKMCDV